MSFSQIKQENDAKFNQVKRVSFDGGVTLDVEQSFRETKVELLLKELLKIVGESMEKGKEITNDIGQTLMIALAIKYFTSLDTDISSFDDYIFLVNELQDREYFQKIVDSFDKTELSKLFDNIFEKLNTFSSILSEQKIKTIEEESKSETV